jgi:hypothetical protein
MAAQQEEGLDRLAEAARLVETTQERWAEACGITVATLAVAPNCLRQSSMPGRRSALAAVIRAFIGSGVASAKGRWRAAPSVSSFAANADVATL